MHVEFLVHEVKSRLRAALHVSHDQIAYVGASQ